MASTHEHSKVTPLVILALLGIFILVAMIGSVATNKQSRSVDRSFAQIAGAHPTRTPTRTSTPMPRYVNCGGVQCLHENCHCTNDACTSVICLSAATPTRTRTPTMFATRTRTPTRICTQNGSCLREGTACCNGVRLPASNCQQGYLCMAPTRSPTRTRTPTRTPTIFRATCNRNSPCQINETLQSSTCEGTSFCPTYWRSFSNCEPPYEGCNRMSYSYDAPCEPNSANCPNGIRCNDSDKKCLFAPEGKQVRCVNPGTTQSYCLVY